MRSLYKTGFALVMAVSLFSSSLNAQFLGGMRLKNDEEGPKGQ